MPTRTEWVLLVIKEAIQFKAEAVMPNCTSRTCRRMEGSTHSNAALNSRRKRAVMRPASRAMNNVVVDF